MIRVTEKGVETPMKASLANQERRFKTSPYHGGWTAVLVETPVNDDGTKGAWVVCTAFSHKGDADRYCQFLNEAVQKFFTTSE